MPRLLPAARLCLAEGLEITALPRNRAGWARLCRLLTLGARRAEKGKCLLHPADLDELDRPAPPAAPAARPRPARAWLPRARAFARRHLHAHLVASPRYDGQDGPRFDRAARGSRRTWACRSSPPPSR